jgi:hypothetical protein
VRNIIIAAAMLALGAAAQADVIASESFDYPAGSITGAAGGTGWSLPWEGTGTVTTPGHAYQNLAVSGNKLTTTGNNSGAFRPLSSTLGADGTTVWISFLANLATPTGTDAYAGISLFNNNDEILFLGKRFNQGFWGFERTGGGTTQAVNSTEAADTGAADLLLYRIDFLPGATDTVTMYVNPDLSNLGIPTPAVGPIAVNDVDANRIRIQSGVAGLAIGNFDELRIGTDMQSVLPVPEPATLSLLGVAALGLLARRRR